MNFSIGFLLKPEIYARPRHPPTTQPDWLIFDLWSTIYHFFSAGFLSAGFLSVAGFLSAAGFFSLGSAGFLAPSLPGFLSPKNYAQQYCTNAFVVGVTRNEVRALLIREFILQLLYLLQGYLWFICANNRPLFFGGYLLKKVLIVGDLGSKLCFGIYWCQIIIKRFGLSVIVNSLSNIRSDWYINNNLSLIRVIQKITKTVYYSNTVLAKCNQQNV